MRRLITALFGLLFAVALLAGPPPASTDTGGLRPAIGTSHPASPTTTPPPAPAVKPAPTPFPGDPGDALQVVSVVAHDRRATTARVLLWQRPAVGQPWTLVAGPFTAHVGASGLTTHPREGFPATPIGSFGLTQAFGRDADTGGRITRLAYHRLRPGDGWSNAPRQYNRLARTGEMFLGRDGWMRLAVLIDYNTAHPRVGAGSGYFLHVAGGGPTDGCVALPLVQLRRVVAWLTPAGRPRIVTAIDAGRPSL